MNSQQVKKYKIPDKPGVYFFKFGGDILYIGKATSLRDRVRSYFAKDPEGKQASNGAGLINTRGPLIVQMVKEVKGLDWKETDSVLEALILEANLIKKYQPKYNTKEKDDKSFNYVCITKEKLPRVLIVRGRNLNTPPPQPSPLVRGRAKGGGLYSNQKNKYNNLFGPFTNGSQLKEAMKIIRRIFPYFDEHSLKKNNREFYKQLGLIPELKVTPKSTFEKVLGRGGREPVPDHFQKYFSASQNAYKKNIKNLILFFQGKKKNILRNLKKEMMVLAKNREFEKAGEIKKQIFVLEHINDVALIKSDTSQKYQNSSRFTPKGPYATQNFDISVSCRIEAYDVAHLAGKNMVGVMTVIEDGETNKNEYRKFNIETQKRSNDTGALKEILERRFTHREWHFPDIVVVDGGKAQINITKKVLQNFSEIKIVSVIKDDKHKPKAIMGDEKIVKKYKKEILFANSEAHRFAITFHKKKRNKNFLK